VAERLSPPSRSSFDPQPARQADHDGNDALGRLAAIAVTVVVGLVAYANVFAGNFVLDDTIEIVANPALRQIWPPWTAMFGGHQVAARPLPYLTFAIDRAIWGLNPAGFHATNLAIHLLTAAGLVMLTIDTLKRPEFPAEVRRAATWLGGICGAVWVAHPLTTAAVSYIYQRIEALAAMFIVWCLWTASRALALPVGIGESNRGIGRGWRAASVALAAGAMLSKETAVVLPLIVTAYWWIYESRRDEGHSRPPLAFLLMVASTWGVMALVLASKKNEYAEFREAVHPPLRYALTQAEVLTHYLRLAFWPTGLCFDYDWPLVSTPLEVAWELAAVLTALGVTAVGVLRQASWSFPLAACFLLLAPTSSIMPVADPAFEHRMYLPLFCLVSLVVSAFGLIVIRARQRVAAGWRPWLLMGTLGLVAAAVAILAAGTWQRNRMFHDPKRLWEDVLSRYPASARGNWMMALDAAQRGDVDAALGHARRSTLSSPWGLCYQQVQREFSAMGDTAAWERACREGIATLEEKQCAGKSNWLDMKAGLIESLMAQGRHDEAETVCRETLPRAERSLGPDHPITMTLRLELLRCRMGSGSLQGLEPEAAAISRRAATVLGPDHATTLAARTAYAFLRAESGNDAEAERELRDVLAIQQTGDGDLLQIATAAENLGNFLASRDRLDDAIDVRVFICDTLCPALGSGHHRSQQALASLAATLEAAGRAVEARQVLEARRRGAAGPGR